MNTHKDSETETESDIYDMYQISSLNSAECFFFGHNIEIHKFQLLKEYFYGLSNSCGK